MEFVSTGHLKNAMTNFLSNDFECSEGVNGNCQNNQTNNALVKIRHSAVANNVIDDGNVTFTCMIMFVSVKKETYYLC